MSKIYIPITKAEDWQSLLADPKKHWSKDEWFETISIIYYVSKNSDIHLYQGWVKENPKYLDL